MTTPATPSKDAPDLDATLSVELSPEACADLEKCAETLGRSPEQLAREAVVKLLEANGVHEEDREIVNQEAPEEEVTLSVKLPAGIHARMEQKAFNGEHVEKMAANWLAQAAIDRLNFDEQLSRDDSGDKYPAAHFHTDEFTEGFVEAFYAWRDVKNALTLVLASFANGPKRRGEEADRIACTETFKDMMLMFRALSTRKRFRKLLGRCHEANRQWLCIEAGHGDPEITADGFREHCGELSRDLYGLV